MLIEYQSKMPGATSENFPLNFFFYKWQFSQIFYRSDFLKSEA